MSMLPVFVFCACLLWSPDFAASLPVNEGTKETSGGNVGCRDQQGNPVDWFIVSKLPIISDYCTTCANVADGTAFLYLDANKPNDWQYSSEPITSDQQAVAYTMNLLFTRKNEYQHWRIMYNDEVPSDAGVPDSSYRGHAKGAAYFEADQGFWLIHSVPRYVTVNGYTYPDSGEDYGQSMICLTLNTNDQLDNIAFQLQYMQPNTYDWGRTLNFASSHLDALQAGQSIQDEPYTRQTTVTTVGGQSFQHFAKCKKWSLDLYADLVRPGVNASLYVETWLNGNAVDLPSVCDGSGFEVHNLREEHPDSLPFKSSKDHSKWAVSYTSGQPWTCVGDINRQESQEDRAGGTMCLSHGGVNALYLAATATSEQCDGTMAPAKGGSMPCST